MSDNECNTVNEQRIALSDEVIKILKKERRQYLDKIERLECEIMVFKEFISFCDDEELFEWFKNKKQENREEK